ncbi:hypothetical protein E5288_WYG008049 [Bos mutus]|uniref:Uncharacterized protein n=1 Tax=Bos mutus TaxID=72004 RepID=A0A6B0RX19_9CETA|nr:hypothetical protein [Bos mutus]
MAAAWLPDRLVPRRERTASDMDRVQWTPGEWSADLVARRTHVLTDDGVVMQAEMGICVFLWTAICWSFAAMTVSSNDFKRKLATVQNDSLHGTHVYVWKENNKNRLLNVDDSA